MGPRRSGSADPPAGAEALGDGAAGLALGATLGDGDVGAVVVVGDAPGPDRNPPGRRPRPTATIREAASNAATTRRLEMPRAGRRERRSISASIRCANPTGTGRGSMVAIVGPEVLLELVVDHRVASSERRSASSAARRC